MRDSSRKTAIAVGVLFIVGTLAGIASATLTGSTTDDAEYIARIAANSDLFRIAGLLVLVMGLSLAFVPIVLWPVLKKQSESLATAYLVFRGALVLYTAFFRSRLIPRWISVFGMITILFSFATGILALFGVVSPASEINTALNMPIGLQEMLMAVWLIAKGFKPAVTG